MSSAKETMTLAGVLENGRNSFNLVRLTAAVAVVVSHSFALFRGEVVGEPLSSITPYTLGQHAVNVFFVLSGLMLSRSFAHKPDLFRFATSRILRIYPALVLCGVVTAMLLGPLGSSENLRAYFSDPSAGVYPLRILFAFNRAKIEGVFMTGTSVPGSINYSLWTIKYELAAYVLFAGFAAIGLVRRRPFAIVLVMGSAALVTALAAGHGDQAVPGLVPAARFLMSFAVGIVAHAFRRQLALRAVWLVALSIAAFATRGSALAPPAWILLAGYLALYLGGLGVPRLSAWAERTDLSYGLYLYAWPVQQLLLFRDAGIDLPTHIAASLIIAGALAKVSWACVEAPSLRLKRLLAPQVLGELVGVAHQHVSHAAGGIARWSRGLRRRQIWMTAAGAGGCAMSLVVSCCLLDMPLFGLDFC